MHTIIIIIIITIIIIVIIIIIIINITIIIVIISNWNIKYEQKKRLNEKINEYKIRNRRQTSLECRIRKQML